MRQKLLALLVVLSVLFTLILPTGSVSAAELTKEQFKKATGVSIDVSKTNVWALDRGQLFELVYGYGLRYNTYSNSTLNTAIDKYVDYATSSLKYTYYLKDYTKDAKEIKYTRDSHNNWYKAWKTNRGFLTKQKIAEVDTYVKMIDDAFASADAVLKKNQTKVKKDEYNKLNESEMALNAYHRKILLKQNWSKLVEEQAKQVAAYVKEQQAEEEVDYKPDYIAMYGYDVDIQYAMQYDREHATYRMENLHALMKSKESNMTAAKITQKISELKAQVESDKTLAKRDDPSFLTWPTLDVDGQKFISLKSAFYKAIDVVLSKDIIHPTQSDYDILYSAYEELYDYREALYTAEQIMSIEKSDHLYNIGPKQKKLQLN